MNNLINFMAESNQKIISINNMILKNNFQSIKRSSVNPICKYNVNIDFYKMTKSKINFKMVTAKKNVQIKIMICSQINLAGNSV